MQDEIDAFEKNSTWHITTLLFDRRVLSSKWVYCIKLKSDGTVKQYKARLVILWNTRLEGEDFTETFAPVVKFVTACP